MARPHFDLHITGYTHMYGLTREVMVKSLSSSLKALADETRLQMVALLLAKGELCVCDVVAALRITQSKASRHLRHLVNAGFLQDRKDGVWVHFRIAEAPGPVQAALIGALAGQFGEGLSAQVEDRLAEWQVRKAKDGVTCQQTTKKKVGGRR